jgi:hypothetical protein
MNMFLPEDIYSIISRLEAIETRENATSWKDMTLTSGWENFGGSWGTAKYRKVGDKVYLSGLIKRTSGTNSVCTIMPVGYRIGSQQMYYTMQGDRAIKRVDIETSGSIRLQSLTNTTYVTLHGIEYFTSS